LLGGCQGSKPLAQLFLLLLKLDFIRDLLAGRVRGRLAVSVGGASR
jgi:hypothetical protein